MKRYQVELFEPPNTRIVVRLGAVDASRALQAVTVDRPLNVGVIAIKEITVANNYLQKSGSKPIDKGGQIE